MTTTLFSPLAIGDMAMQNRIIVSPMCQYSAKGGIPSDWHIMHIGQFAVANPGLILLEGTAVLPDGRITDQDLCLYNDAQQEGLRRLVEFVRAHSQSKIGIQLFHAGRKGSQNRPWDNGTRYGESDTLRVEDGGWQVSGPSAIGYDANYPVPHELDVAQLEDIKQAFVTSARRAAVAGLDTVELHYAHGYMLHTFLSAVSNKRTDDYGGSQRNRMRFPLEVFEAVRRVWPEEKPLGARISGSDFGLDEGSWNVEDAVVFAHALKAAGCDYLDVSGGFLSPNQDFMSGYGPSFQVNLAAQVREAVSLTTFSVGLINGAKQADQIVREGFADAVAIGRGMLYDPRWPWHAAQELGAAPVFPTQYERAFDHDYPAMFAAAQKK